MLETTSTNLLSRETKRRVAAAGHPLSTRDPNGVGQDCVYDVLGRDVQCTDTAHHVTQSVYDRAGNKTCAIDAKGKTTYSLYDPRGRLLRKTDQTGATITHVYDPAGRIQQPLLGERRTGDGVLLGVQTAPLHVRQPRYYVS